MRISRFSKAMHYHRPHDGDFYLPKKNIKLRATGNGLSCLVEMMNSMFHIKRMIPDRETPVL